MAAYTNNPVPLVLVRNVRRACDATGEIGES